MKFLLLMLLVVVVKDVRAETDGKLTEDEIKYLVERHNIERANQSASNMYKIVWDTDLESKAQATADKCLWEHTDDSIRTWGENMGIMMFPNVEYLEGFSVKKKIDITVTEGMTGFQSWAGEKVNDKKHDFSCFRPEWTGPTCGHYTQVVWHSSNKLGCGTRHCYQFNMGADKVVNDVWFIVCAYMEPGNMAGEDPFKTGTACSECEDGDKCEDGLCLAE